MHTIERGAGVRAGTTPLPLQTKDGSDIFAVSSHLGTNSNTPRNDSNDSNNGRAKRSLHPTLSFPLEHYIFLLPCPFRRTKHSYQHIARLCRIQNWQLPRSSTQRHHHATINGQRQDVESHETSCWTHQTRRPYHS